MQMLITQEITMGAVLFQVETTIIENQFVNSETVDQSSQHLSVKQQQALQQLLKKLEMIFCTPSTFSLKDP